MKTYTKSYFAIERRAVTHNECNRSSKNVVTRALDAPFCVTVAEIYDGQLAWLTYISSYRLLPLGFNLIQKIIKVCDECNISATVTDNWTEVLT